MPRKIFDLVVRIEKGKLARYDARLDIWQTDDPSMKQLLNKMYNQKTPNLSLNYYPTQTAYLGELIEKELGWEVISWGKTTIKRNPIRVY